MFLQVEADGELLGLFCGTEETDTEVIPAQRVITSPRNSLSVCFSSDFSNEKRFYGFVAHYSAVGEDQKTRLRPRPESVLVCYVSSFIKPLCVIPDVDECSERTDEGLLCDHFCHNYIGGYYCSCRYGYLLHHDNRTCRGASAGVL